jgi:hypothetical protein
MAIIDDMDYPQLTPHDDRYQASGNLFRTPKDLTDEQFDLLAAARAEEALTGESLAEFELLLSDSSDKKAYADSFRQLRLLPSGDHWEGLESLLKTSPSVKTIRRALYITLAAAAGLLALITIRHFTARQLDFQTPVSLPELTIVAERNNSQSVHITHEHKMSKPVPAQVTTEAGKTEATGSIPEAAVKIAALEVNHQAVTPVIAAVTPGDNLLPVRFNEISTPLMTDKEENWILKGIARISQVFTKGDKPVDSYAIADACIKTINNILGCNMELNRVVSQTGRPVSVNFSSSLLSFSAPAKKTSP